MTAAMGIEKNIKFLGFIDRADQLALMKKSIAVIQPSFFEGWSTVVEDAKALSVKIIASAIPVHQEQLQEYNSKQFFLADNEIELSKCMLNYYRNEGESAVYDYRQDVCRFGTSFMAVINKVVTDNH